MGSRSLDAADAVSTGLMRLLWSAQPLLDEQLSGLCSGHSLAANECTCAAVLQGTTQVELCFALDGCWGLLRRVPTDRRILLRLCAPSACR